jgi:hypothetical protein
MVETRPSVPGFYKGLIYCSDLKEARRIEKNLDTEVSNRLGLRLPLTIKRGCSEYAAVYPEYNNFKSSGIPLMNYDEDWKGIEENYDLENTVGDKRLITPSLLSLCLSDILIIRNWIDYACGIGDSTAGALTPNTTKSHVIFRIAKERLQQYPRTNHY